MPSPSFSSISLFRILRAERGRRKAAPQVVSPHLACLQKKNKTVLNSEFNTLSQAKFNSSTVRSWSIKKYEISRNSNSQESVKAVGSSQQDVRIFKKYVTTYTVSRADIGPDRSSQLVISVAWLLIRKKKTHRIGQIWPPPFDCADELRKSDCTWSSKGKKVSYTAVITKNRRISFAPTVDTLLWSRTDIQKRPPWRQRGLRASKWDLPRHKKSQQDCHVPHCFTIPLVSPKPLQPASTRPLAKSTGKTWNPWNPDSPQQKLHKTQLRNHKSTRVQAFIQPWW